MFQFIVSNYATLYKKFCMHIYSLLFPLLCSHCSGKLNPLCIKFGTLGMKHFCGLAALCAYGNDNQTSEENSARTTQVCLYVIEHMYML